MPPNMSLFLSVCPRLVCLLCLFSLNRAEGSCFNGTKPLEVCAVLCAHPQTAIDCHCEAEGVCGSQV